MGSSASRWRLKAKLYLAPRPSCIWHLTRLEGLPYARAYVHIHIHTQIHKYIHAYIGASFRLPALPFDKVMQAKGFGGNAGAEAAACATGQYLTCQNPACTGVGDTTWRVFGYYLQGVRMLLSIEQKRLHAVSHVPLWYVRCMYTHTHTRTHTHTHTHTHRGRIHLQELCRNSFIGHHCLHAM